MESGRKRITIVNGGLTARVRRKYKLNSILRPDANDEEDAEKKNRADDRHHALDAMVISFIPAWTREARKEHFFRFPDRVNRDFLARHIAEVMPRNLCLEKPALGETIYGARNGGDRKVIVLRSPVVKLAYKSVTPSKSVYDLKYAVKQVKAIRDAEVRRLIEAVISSQPSEEAWNKACSTLSLRRKDGSPGSRIMNVLMDIGTADEYKDLSKDGRGAWRRAKKEHKGQIIYWNEKGVIAARPIFAHGSVAKERRSLESLGGSAKFYGFFRSNCAVRTRKEVPAEKYKLVVKNESNQKRRIAAQLPLPACELTLRTIVTKGLTAELSLRNGERVVASLDVWVEAGLARLGDTGEP